MTHRELEISIGGTIIWDRKIIGVKHLQLKRAGIIPYTIDSKKRIKMCLGVTSKEQCLTDFSSLAVDEDINIICTAIRGCRYQSCGLFSFSLRDIESGRKLFIYDETTLIIFLQVDSDDYKEKFDELKHDENHPIDKIENITSEGLNELIYSDSEILSSKLKVLLHGFSLISSIIKN